MPRKSTNTQAKPKKKKYVYPPRRAMFSKTEVRRAIKAVRANSCEPVRIDFHKDGFSLVLAEAKNPSGDTMASINEQQLKELL